MIAASRKIRVKAADIAVRTKRTGILLFGREAERLGLDIAAQDFVARVLQNIRRVRKQKLEFPGAADIRL